MNKKGVIYCRVSTTKQEKNGASLDDQEKACRDFCKTKNIMPIGVFREAFSGKTRDREILQEAILQAKEK